MPEQRDPALADQRQRAREQLARARRGSPACRRSPRGSVCERVARVKSSKRSRSITVRHDALRRAQPPRRRRSTSATRIASSSAGACGAAGRARAGTPIERRRGPRLHPPRVAVVRERVQVPARRAADASPTSVASRQRGDLADRREPARVQLAPRSPRRRPTAARPAAGAGTPAPRSGGHDEQPVGLRRPRSRPWRGTSSARRRP